jgi:hypothetical protein
MSIKKRKYIQIEFRLTLVQGLNCCTGVRSTTEFQAHYFKFHDILERTEDVIAKLGLNSI